MRWLVENMGTGLSKLNPIYPGVVVRRCRGPFLVTQSRSNCFKPGGSQPRAKAVHSRLGWPLFPSLHARVRLPCDESRRSDPTSLFLSLMSYLIRRPPFPTVRMLRSMLATRCAETKPRLGYLTLPGGNGSCRRPRFGVRQYGRTPNRRPNG